MKKLNKRILLSLLTIGYLLTTSAQNSYGSHDWNPAGEMLSDSSTKNSLIIVDSFNLEILPPSSGVQFYKDGIIFLSSTKKEEKMVPEHLSFGSTEAYYAILLDTALGEHNVFSPTSAFTYPCEALSFSSGNTAMYFTKLSKKDGREKIYEAEYALVGKKPGWVCSVNPLNFCTDNSAFTHPTLSSDGEMMIFASDKSGNLGGMDLFITHKEGDKWSEPKNLGSSINTKDNELYPFLDSENNLYFSSDGLPGFGGFDIFMSKFNGDKWDEPINLSKRINSENDDVAFTVSRKDGKSAFFTSKQKSDKSKMQLYKVSMNGKNGSDDTNLSSVLYNLVLLETGAPHTKKIVSDDKAQTAQAKPDSKIQEVSKVDFQAKQEAKIPDKNLNETAVIKSPVKTTPNPEKNTKPAAVPTVTAEKVKVEPAGVVTPVPVVVAPPPTENKNVVIYRIQFASSSSSKGSYSVTIDGKTYKTFEYFYKGAYRSAMGELKTLNEAKTFQAKCRASGFPQAFAVVFVNNERSLDPALFK
jgi:hypothetical protein